MRKDRVKRLFQSHTLAYYFTTVFIKVECIPNNIKK